MIERVDLQALIRSLSGQIARAFLDENPELQIRPAPQPGVFLNASAAEMLLRALLTPDNIAALLSQGRVGVIGAGGKDAGTLWGMPSLGQAFHARPLEVLMHSYLDGPRSFVVGLDSPDGRYRIHMNLSGLTWRMSGVDVPEPIIARLTHLIAAADRWGGRFAQPVSFMPSGVTALPRRHRRPGSAPAPVRRSGSPTMSPRDAPARP